MASGLFALLDDVAAIANVAAASVDDVVAQATKAGTKAAGIVIDDAAVTPRYAVGFAASRELPIIWKIALGSLKNKLLFLLPGALILALVAPWLITPLLMMGGVYLCYEGAEKILELVVPHAAATSEEAGKAVLDPKLLEEQKIAGAIKTDFILSAEIMAITLSTVSTASFQMQATVLAVVGIGITVLVYGAVALIVKADDIGLALAKQSLAPVRMFGRGLVIGMPYFLSVLSAVGTAAMLWVGGGIIIHGLEEFGLTGLGHTSHGLAAAAGAMLPLGGVLEWLAGAVFSAVFGLIVGGIAIVAMHYVVQPVMKGMRKTRQPA
ncbi:MAG: ABC transporter [Bosea sp. 12-68-7]|nr:MAG: ABC transporter [Bosea sp. 12-68-7]OYX03068.1 MAG: ABC transporter [Bosea sp. 32-68-6]